jgi:uncharacterized protein (DUF302 family)
MRSLQARNGGWLAVVTGIAAAAGAYFLFGPEGAGVSPAGPAAGQEEGGRQTTFTAARVDVTSRKTFEQVVKALEAGVPKAGFTLFDPPGSAGVDAATVRRKLNDLPDKEGLLILAQSEVGQRQSELLGRKVRSKLYFIGNPLVAGRMIARDPAASLYVPLRVLVYEGRDGKAHVAYHRPSSVLGSLGDEEITRVAKMLDRKFQEVVTRAAE